MQPEDPKEAFQPPQETEYFSQTEVPTEEVVASGATPRPDDAQTQNT